MAGGTGNGAAVAFSGGLSAFSAEVESIGAWSPEVPAIDLTLVSDTNYQRFIAGKIMEHGPISLGVVWNATKAAATYNGNAGTRYIGLTGTLTLTFPITVAGNSTKATFAGSGFITSFPTPEITSNQKMSTNLMFQYDGTGTVPVWTAEA